MTHKTVSFPCGISVEFDPTSKSGHLNSGVSGLTDPDDFVDDEYAAERAVGLNGAVNGLESLILACACAGVDVESSEFAEAVQSAHDAIVNEYT